MALDLCLVFAVFLFGLFGMQSGATRQLAHWAGLAAGWLLARPLATRLTPLAAPHLRLPAVAVRVALDGALFCVLGAAAAALVHALLSKFAVERGRADRGSGFALGAGKGAFLLFALLSLLLFFEKTLIRFAGQPPAAIESSWALRFARAHNLLAVVPLPLASKLERLAEAARDPRAASASLAREPELKALLDDPALKSALQNDEFLRALRSGDISALQNDPRLAALLHDPRFDEAATPR